MFFLFLGIPGLDLGSSFGKSFNFGSWKHSQGVIPNPYSSNLLSQSFSNLFSACKSLLAVSKGVVKGLFKVFPHYLVVGATQSLLQLCGQRGQGDAGPSARSWRAGMGSRRTWRRWDHGKLMEFHQAMSKVLQLQALMDGVSPWRSS